MKIAQILPITLPIPSKYGGLERVVCDLIEGLRSKGHDVTVYTTGNSEISGKKYFYEKNFPSSYMRDPIDVMANLTHLSLSLQDALKTADIIHSHIAYLPNFITPFIDKPVLITMHNPIERPERKDILCRIKNKYLVSISKNQQKGVHGVEFIKTIYNGVDTNIFTPIQKNSGSKENFLLWVGRFREEKGAKIAIDVARKLNMKLVLIGPKVLADPVYFAGVMAEVDGKQIIYAGEKSREEIIPYYQKAKVFLFPIGWEEPFGLVAVEAMACGTPVVAFNRGSVPEIILDRVTGYICPGNVSAMAAAIKKITGMQSDEYQKMRNDCQAHVCQNFSIESMVNNYEKIYQKLM